MERSYDDPSITDLSQCIYDMCIKVEESCNLDNTTIIKGRKFAVYPFKGLVTEIYSVIQGVIHQWLPHSDYEIDEKYMLNI